MATNTVVHTGKLVRCHWLLRAVKKGRADSFRLPEGEQGWARAIKMWVERSPCLTLPIARGAGFRSSSLEFRRDEE